MEIISSGDFGDANYYESLRDVSRKREELRKKNAVNAKARKDQENRNKGPFHDEEKTFQGNRRKAFEYREMLNSGQYRNETIEAVCRSFQKDVQKKESTIETETLEQAPEKSQVIPLDDTRKDVRKRGSAVETEKLVEAPKESQQVEPSNEGKKAFTKKKTSQSNRKQRNALLNALNEKKKVVNKAEPSTSEMQSTKRVLGKCSAVSAENEPSSSHNAMTSIIPLAPTPSESLDVTEQFQFLLMGNADFTDEETQDDDSVTSSITSNYTTASNTSNYTTASSRQERFVKKEKKIEKKTSQRRRLYKPCQSLLTDPPSKKPWTYSPKELIGEQLPEYTKSNFPALL